jgi:hypothetical protein
MSKQQKKGKINQIRKYRKPIYPIINSKKQRKRNMSKIPTMDT